MKLHTKRVYDPPGRGDGMRVLIDRLWPRGLTKAKASIDLWAKDTAPSHELRQWFGHAPEKFDAFAERYRAELDAHNEALDNLVEQINAEAAAGVVTLVYAAKDIAPHHAPVLRDVLQPHFQ